jgi:hypothetical protein
MPAYNNIHRQQLFHWIGGNIESDIINHMHHIVPVAEGGPSEYGNLIPVCASCHSKINHKQTSRKQLRRAKAHWARENVHFLIRLISSNSMYEVQKREFLEAFDAAKDIGEFRKFRSRLRRLVKRDEAFQNFIRVSHHDILHEVNANGDVHVYERQTFSPFMPLKVKRYQISSTNEATQEDLDFQAKAFIRGREVQVQSRIGLDEPKFKTFEVEFLKRVSPSGKAEVHYNYFWPRGWVFPKDRYTYDVLAWAEEVNYKIVFPEHIQIASCSTSFMDIFGSEWPDIGKCTAKKNRLCWTGKRLPMFSQIIIRHETHFDK